MCKICVDYQKGLLTLDEAWHNLNELEDTKHAVEVAWLLTETENTEKEEDAKN